MGPIVRRRLLLSLLAQGPKTRSSISDDLPNPINQLGDLPPDSPTSGGVPDEGEAANREFFFLSGNPVPPLSPPVLTRRAMTRLTERKMRVSFTKGAGK